MAKRGTKATRKFAASGQLTKKIQARRKHQQIQRKNNKSAKSKRGEDESKNEEPSAKAKDRCVLYILSFGWRIHIFHVVSKACR